jgi:uncharacterized protein (TIGR00730 family)
MGGFQMPSKNGSNCASSGLPSVEIKAVTVYCGSNMGNKPIFAETAKQFALEVSRRNYDVVYGGASVGLMGVVADTVLANKGRVIGVITEALLGVEMAHKGLTEMFVVPDMHERKAMMHDMGDAFVILPGGSGSMDEFFEIHTWAQLGYHQKPIGLLNINGYYEPVREFYNMAVNNGFTRAEHRDMLIIESDPATLLDRLACYKAPTVSKWLDKK